MRIMSSIVGFLAGFFLIAASAVAQQNSGFLGDNYSKLQDAQSPSGARVKRWLAPVLAPGKYDAVVIDNTVLYPEPKGAPQVSVTTLKEIAAYLDEALRRELTGVTKLATEPGPKTLRIKPAITGAAAKNQGFKPYDVLPIAFVFSTVKKAAGGATKEAFLAVEYEVWDVETNQLVGVGVRQGTGQALKNPTDSVTLANVKPVIDAWAKDVRMFFQSKP